jgi:hypothetical protein
VPAISFDAACMTALSEAWPSWSQPDADSFRIALETMPPSTRRSLFTASCCVPFG